MALAPTNVRVAQDQYGRPLDAINGSYVIVTWDDPNPPGSTTQIFIYNANGSQIQGTGTSSLSDRTAVVPGGSWQIALKSGNVISFKTPFTVSAKPAEAPTPPPTDEETIARAYTLLSDADLIEHALELVDGSLAAGDKVALYLQPATVRTVAADGSVS